MYYDRDEERATEEWKKSGDNWFWLDDNGEMAVDQLIEDDDDYYYVNESGAMVTNQWVAIENEDAGEEDEPDYYWTSRITTGTISRQTARLIREATAHPKAPFPPRPSMAKNTRLMKRDVCSTAG